VRLDLLPGDILWLGVMAAVVFGGPILDERLGGLWAGRPSMPVRILFIMMQALIWGLYDFGLIPRLVATVASVVILIGLLIAPDDDDHRRRRKGRLRAAWKRSREYLAHGVAAPRTAEP